MSEGMMHSAYFMLQLVCACSLFFIHGRKKTDFLKRMLLSVFLLEIFSLIYFYLFAGILPDIYFSISSLIYLLLCIPFIRFCLDVSWMHASYCVACAFAVQHLAFGIVRCYEILYGRIPWWSIFIYLLSYIFCYLCFIRHFLSGGEYSPRLSDLLPIATIFFFATFLSVIERNTVAPDDAIVLRILFQCSDILCCVYILWTQTAQQQNMRLQRELGIMDQLIEQQRNQYELTQATIGIINQKCHDMKHQLHRLRNSQNEKEQSRYFQELEQAINIYDSAIQTGNPGLDIILMEKSLYCQNNGIQWTCLLDGTKLDFMESEDIYAVFGNILDNAITAVMELDDPEKRIISITMRTQEQLLVIQIQNYYTGERNFIDGLPATTKNDTQNHGYGMKSIRYTVEKYHGMLNIRTEDSIFTLQILLPTP